MNKGFIRTIPGIDRCYLLLALLLLFHLINNIIIVSIDNTPFLWDGGDYFYRSLRYYDVFANIDSNFFSRFNEVSPYRPPLFLLTSLPFYLVFGRSPDVAVMTNFVYLIILVFSVYGIGKKIHSQQVGLLASFIVSTFPIIFGSSRSYWLDFPLTAMVAISIYFLLKTDYFGDRKYSILFGISAGLGMLTKWTYFVFLTGPFLYIFMSFVRINLEAHKKATRPLFNIFLAILLGMVVASFWYIPNGLNVASKLFGLAIGVTGETATRFQQLGETIGPSGIFNAKSFTYYAGQFVNHQVTFLSAALLVICIFILLRNGDRENFWWLLLWVIVPIIAFTLIKNKTPRNTVPMLPAIGLIISLGIIRISKERLRNGLITLVIALGVFQYTVSSYGAAPLPRQVSVKIPLGDVMFFQQHENSSYALYRAKTGDWKAAEILNIIDSTRSNAKSVDIVLIPRDAFTWMSMEYSSYLKSMPFNFIGAVDYPESVLHADYILVKKGGFVAPWFVMHNIHRSLDLMDKNREDFTLLKTVPLPEERLFLPIYDITAEKNARESGIIFSKRLQVSKYSVSELLHSSGREFTVHLILKSLQYMDGELKVVFHLLNKKMEPLMRKGVDSVPQLSGLKIGEERTAKATLIVPSIVAENIFSLEIGFFDTSLNSLLTYQPEYLIYKRK
jgi:4-amino-4-deoxy-L-arabinose transferase-like glycosyltransferase